MTIEARFANPDLDLKPGMFATARVRLPGMEQAVLVPRSAILTDPSTESSQVFVIADDRASVRVVRLGDSVDELVRVLSGVTAGESVAVTNLGQLYDGLAVQPTDSASETKGSAVKERSHAKAS
jgi:multidrug efflux pump subunit AcrA (membrane-fusion protein)